MIQLLVMIALIGFLCYLITTLVPMDAKFHQAIVLVGIAIVIFMVLSAFGLLTSFDVPLPRVR